MEQWASERHMIRESLGKSWDEVRENFSGYAVSLDEPDIGKLVSIILFPKREEHVHLDGSANFELLQNFGFQGTKEDIQSPRGGGLAGYLRPFQEIGRWMQTEKNLFLISRQFVLDQYKEGIVQTEVRYDPHLHVFGWLSIHRVMESVFLWLHAGVLSLDGKIKVKAILWVNRWLSPDEAKAISDEMLVFLEEHPEWGSWVSGFDLNCAESGNPPSKHREVLSDWKKRGYPLIIHAGEELSEDQASRSSYVREAIELGVRRMGHAILCQDDPEALASIREANIGIEICVSSNWQTGANNDPDGHPLERYMEQWLVVSINTDNKTVGNMTLSEEILLIHKKLWIDLRMLLELTRW